MSEADKCCAKADELEALAAETKNPENAEEYRRLAQRWRELAAKAEQINP
jgi:hypothetical protein